MKKKFLFMCGTPRSGTSFMASIVGSHPDIVMGVERFSLRYADRSLRPSHFERDRFFDVRPDDTRHSVDTAFFRNREALARKFERCAFVGDKYPNLSKQFTWLREEFADPAFIFVLRNPVDVGRSWAVRAARPRDKWPATNGFDAAIADWGTSLGRVVSWRKRGCRIFVLDYDLAVSGTEAAGAHLDDLFTRIGAAPSAEVRSLLAAKADTARRPAPSAEERAAIGRLLDEKVWTRFDKLIAAERLPRPAWTESVLS